MAGKIVNNVKYIALMNSNSDKSKSLNENIWRTLRDVFLNCESEDNTNETNNIMLSFIKQNDDKYVIDDFGYKKIYGFLNSLEERSFYFAEEPFEEDTEYIKFDIWWKNLQSLIKELENIIINTEN